MEGGERVKKFNYKNPFYVVLTMLLLGIYYHFTIRGDIENEIERARKTVSEINTKLKIGSGEFYNAWGAIDTVFIVTNRIHPDTSFYMRTDLVNRIRMDLIDAQIEGELHKRKRAEIQKLLDEITAANDIARDYVVLKQRFDFYQKYYEQQMEGGY